MNAVREGPEQYGFVTDRIIAKKVVTKTVIRRVKGSRRLMIRELPASERPVNRVVNHGAGSLSTIELLAAILQTPDALSLASEIMAHFGCLRDIARTSTIELQQVQGIGPSKAAQIKAALELGRRLLIASPQERPQVKSPADAANLLMLEMGQYEQEHMVVVLLDSKNRVIATPTVYIGSLNTSLIRVGEMFKHAIRACAAAVIIVHNHPSGDPTPSPEDIGVTEMFVAAGKMLDIDVLDHLIIGQQRYVSLKERGLGFN